MKNKEQLQETLVATIEVIRTDKKRVARIKNGLKKYKILPGTVQLILNEPQEQLKQIDDKFLCLLTEQVYVASGNLELNPENYFSKREIKEVKSTFEGEVQKKVDFPYTFKPAIQIAPDMFITKIKASEIKLFMDNKLLQYNFETQREARIKVDKNDPTNIIQEVKINKKHMEHIKESIVKGEALPSSLTFNARLGTGDEGFELVYDEDTMELTIQKGTLLDCLDGFHRVTAVVKALEENPETDMTFMLNVVNFDIPKAREYFAQMNTIEPIGKGHLENIKKERQADFIVDQLKYNSELKGRISPSEHIPHTTSLLVSLKTLADAIDEVYGIEDRVEAIKTANYLKEFFNQLFYAFPDEFLGDVAAIREKSLINANVMFYGYVLLSKRMKDENISLDKLPEIIKKIDFSRDNEVWKKYKVLDEDKNVTTRAKRGIYKFFEELDLV
ncbi:DNA sulfur modification protein DndB [Geobacillus thermodenitrificans]|uniref:DNA sulfur modification protein DndB n=1 Tax=Geobacillus thermodenitrificans TaxID=33940 RepID=UPI003D1B596E